MEEETAEPKGSHQIWNFRVTCRNVTVVLTCASNTKTVSTVLAKDNGGLTATAVHKCSVGVIGLCRRCRSQEWTSLRIPSLLQVLQKCSWLTIYTSGNWQWCGEEVGRLSMSLHMQSQVIRATEATFAMGALERLGPCMLAIVTGQFVGPRKPPLASLPGAFVWFLSWKQKIPLLPLCH